MIYFPISEMLKHKNVSSLESMKYYTQASLDSLLTLVVRAAKRNIFHLLLRSTVILTKYHCFLNLEYEKHSYFTEALEYLIQATH